MALLNETHKSLRDAVARVSAKQLGVKPRGSKRSNLDVITGIGAHDLYHTGQIQLIKRLMR